MSFQFPADGPPPPISPSAIDLNATEPIDIVLILAPEEKRPE